MRTASISSWFFVLLFLLTANAVWAQVSGGLPPLKSPASSKPKAPQVSEPISETSQAPRGSVVIDPPQPTTSAERPPTTATQPFPPSRNSTPSTRILPNLTSEELESIEFACQGDKVLNGPAVYNTCLRKQLAQLRR